MQIPTTEETVFWAILSIIAILLIAFSPFINNYWKNKEVERMFDNNESL